MPEPSNVTPLNRREIGELGEDGKKVYGPRLNTGNRKRAKKKGHRVALVDLDVLSKVRMTQAELAVFSTIARYIPERGGVEARVSLAEVANDTGMLPQSVSRVISDLVARDLIIRGERRGVWIINPHILYNGEFMEWNDVVGNYIEPKVDR